MMLFFFTGKLLGALVYVIIIVMFIIQKTIKNLKNRKEKAKANSAETIFVESTTLKISTQFSRSLLFRKNMYP